MDHHRSNNNGAPEALFLHNQEGMAISNVTVTHLRILNTLLRGVTVAILLMQVHAVTTVLDGNSGHHLECRVLHTKVAAVMTTIMGPALTPQIWAHLHRGTTITHRLKVIIRVKGMGKISMKTRRQVSIPMGVHNLKALTLGLLHPSRIPRHPLLMLHLL